MSTFESRKLRAEDISRLIRSDVLEEQDENLYEEDQVLDLPQEKKKRVGILAKNIKAIKTVCLAFVFLSAITSVYFLFLWNKVDRGVALGLVIAVIMTGCQTLLPELAIFLFMKKRPGAFLGGLLVGALGLIATAFAISSTIGGLYDSRSANIYRRGEIRDDDILSRASSISIEMQSLRQQRTIAESALMQYQKDEEMYSKEVEAAYNGNGRSSYALESKLTTVRNSIRSAAKQLADIDGRLAKLASDPAAQVKPRTDFYSWAGARFGIEADTVEFAMSSFPALFNEIIAPTMLAVVLFL